MTKFYIPRVSTRHPLLAPYNDDYSDNKFDVTIEEKMTNEFLGKYNVTGGLKGLLENGKLDLWLRIECNKTSYDEAKKITFDEDGSFIFNVDTDKVIKGNTTLVTTMLVTKSKIGNLRDFIENELHLDYQNSKLPIEITPGTILAICEKQPLWEKDGTKGGYFKFDYKKDNEEMSTSFRVDLGEQDKIYVIFKNKDEFNTINLIHRNKKYRNIIYALMHPILIDTMHQMGYEYNLKETDSRAQAQEDYKDCDWYNFLELQIVKHIPHSSTLFELAEFILIQGKKTPTGMFLGVLNKELFSE